MLPHGHGGTKAPARPGCILLPSLDPIVIRTYLRSSIFQEFRSPYFHNGLFPGSCPARRCPARQGGSFPFPFPSPSCVRSLAKRQLQPSLACPFPALHDAVTVCDGKVFSLGAMSDSPDCGLRWIYLDYRWFGADYLLFVE